MLNAASIFKTTGLPIVSSLDAVTAALAKNGKLVLRAEPGAGKTSLVPLVLALDSIEPPARAGKVLVLEPRRVAAVQAAGRDAELAHGLSSPALAALRAPGAIGWRVRGGSQPGSKIEFITTGIFLRMIQSDPVLEGVSTVIFDEFHERSLDADLSLAFLLETRELVPELRLLLMSATIEPGRTAEFLGAGQLDVPGRCFPVEDSYRPVDQGRAFARETAAAIADFAEGTEGGLLVFLPGAGEIGAVGRELSAIGINSTPLYAALSLEEQRRVIRTQSESLDEGPRGADRDGGHPSNSRRRIILATSIAETSLTVPGITAVVDSGLARLSRYDPRTGLNRLVTERESADRAEQRRGRAGRLGPGRCLRLWNRTDVLPERAEPEILRTELSGFVLESAVWGITDPLKLPLLDPPPRASIDTARALLASLGALADNSPEIGDPILGAPISGDGAEGATEAACVPTELGRSAAALGIEPRLAVLAIKAARRGAAAAGAGLAALLEEGLPRQQDADSQGDLDSELEALGMAGAGAGGRGAQSSTGHGDQRYSRIADEARRIEAALARDSRHPGGDRPGGDGAGAGVGAILAAGFPDRVAKRVGSAPEGGLFQLPGGRQLLARGRLGAAPWIVVADADSGGAEGLKPGMDSGMRAQARVFSGAALSPEEALTALEPLITESDELEWDGLRCHARRRKRAGSILLSETALGAAPAGKVQAALAARIAAMGLSILPWKEGGAGALLARMRWYGRAVPEPDWPDLSEAALAADAADWLCPYAASGGGAIIDGETLRTALEGLIPPGRRLAFQREAPARYELPGGHSAALDYEAALAASPEGLPSGPSIEARVEDFFGQTDTPRLAGRPLSLVLLSPARRPLQITSDLAGFWAGAWKEVRKELRGRYPKHDWPEDPAHASPPQGRPRRRES